MSGQVTSWDEVRACGCGDCRSLLEVYERCRERDAWLSNFPQRPLRYRREAVLLAMWGVETSGGP